MFEPTHSNTTQMSPHKCSNSCFSKTPIPSPKKQNEFRKTPSLCFAKVVKHPRSKEAKLARNLRKYPMLEPCSCYYDCREHFTDEQRAAYHLEFWQGNYQEQFEFLSHFVYEFNKKQDTSEKRLYRRQYSLQNYEFHQVVIFFDVMFLGIVRGDWQNIVKIGSKFGPPELKFILQTMAKDWYIKLKLKSSFKFLI